MATPESKLKDYLVQEVAKLNWMLAKTSTPHWPDWWVAAGGVEGGSGLIELKAPRKAPTAEQHEVMTQLHRRGMTVGWADSRIEVDIFLDRLALRYGLSRMPTRPPRAAKPKAATSTPTTAPKRSQGLPTTQATGALRLKQKRPLKGANT